MRLVSCGVELLCLRSSGCERCFVPGLAVGGLADLS